MASFRPPSAGGVGGGDTSSIYNSRAPVDTSHYLTSSPNNPYTPTTKTIDIQTDSTELCQHMNMATSASTQTAATSVPSPISSPSPQLTVHQQQEIAKYIASKMKEQYMEQTRTLEQLQLQMKQQLQDKQAQLMQQITSMDLQPGSEGNNHVILSTPASVKPTDTPTLKTTPNNSSRSPYNSITSKISNSSVSSAASNSTSKPTNGFTSLCNGSNGGEVVRQPAAMTSSLSADESNTSQGSSHDTWDSTNAFTHERPVLTGSERSTPVLPSNNSSNDLELLSQSIHIPLDNKDNQTHTISPSEPQVNTDSSLVNPTLTSIKSVDDLIDLKSQTPEPTAADDITPRNAAAPTDPVNKSSAATQISAVDMNTDQSAVDKIEEEVLTRELSPTGDTYSTSSTPPPESPADDLSASLRFSLRQKHSRHLEDMKAYYEQELHDLRHKLTSSTAVTQHEMYLSLENENQKLRERCRVLEEELLRANRYINTVDKQMEDLESSFNATLASSGRPAAASFSPLQTDHTADQQLNKSKLAQAESYIKSLESKNSELFTALCDAFEVRDNTARQASQGNVIYDEMKSKYEELQLSNQTTQVKLEATELCLRESSKDMDNLKHSIKRLEVEHLKLAKENELLRLQQQQSPTPQRNGSFNHSGLTIGDDGRTMSPMIKAERQLENSFSSGSPSKHRSRHHQYYSDKSHRINKTGSSTEKSPADANDELSPQPQSDATQSSENSSRGHHSKHNHHRSSRKSSHRHSTEHKHSSNDQHPQTPTTTTQHNFTKDDLISAYSPIVDRQRHSSSASSSGPAIKSGNSPTRHSMERPYGYHHVGASVSPSKRTQQWAVLHVSPFNRTPDRHHRDNREPATPSSAKKNLNFALNKTPERSPQKTKSKQDEVLEKVRTGKVFSDEPVEVTPSPAAISYMKNKSVAEDRWKLIKDAETRLDELLMEKRQLESALTRVSSSSSAHTRKDKLRQENLEAQLDRVDKDLGSVRMTLRRYNAL